MRITKLRTKKRKTNKGITLIVLVITIIILLILAGVSISILTGESGILQKASKTKQETRKAEYEETLKIMQVDLEMDRKINNWTEQKMMEEYFDRLHDNKKFEGATIIKKDDSTIQITTSEGEIFIVTKDKVEYIGKQGEKAPPDLQTSDVKFDIRPSSWTNQDIILTITTSIKGYNLQYSINGQDWINYVKDISIVKNQSIYVRLVNNLGETGGYVTTNITNIDKLSPKQFTPTATVTTNSITLTGYTMDTEKTQENGSSGIAKYYFSNDDGLSWVPDNGQIDTSYIFSGLVSGTTYNLKMKAVDNAGNEMITDAIQKTTNKPLSILKEGNYVNYKDKEGTTRKCIVLYDSTSSYGTQIITEDSVEDLTLGDNTNFEKAKSAWNNVIVNLNEKATNYLNPNYANSARCVGSVPNNPNYEATSNYSTTGLSSAFFQENLLKNLDNNSDIDKAQLSKLGIDKLETEYYWLASRKKGNTAYSFCIEQSDIKKIPISSTYQGIPLIVINITGGSSSSSPSSLCTPKFYTRTAGFRPVITLKSNISITAGQGTSDSPYILEI
ncbi:MAG: hypothetical protein HFJ33_07145 [Clostridia bacterium]|nr:hypothetical protein [Clostridia bacterium]